jgi:hypothetical protein
LECWRRFRLGPRASSAAGELRQQRPSRQGLPLEHSDAQVHADGEDDAEAPLQPRPPAARAAAHRHARALPQQGRPGEALQKEGGRRSRREQPHPPDQRSRKQENESLKKFARESLRLENQKQVENQIFEFILFCFSTLSKKSGPTLSKKSSLAILTMSKY